MLPYGHVWGNFQDQTLHPLKIWEGIYTDIETPRFKTSDLETSHIPMVPKVIAVTPYCYHNVDTFTHASGGNIGVASEQRDFFPVLCPEELILVPYTRCQHQKGGGIV